MLLLQKCIWVHITRNSAYCKLIFSCCCGKQKCTKPIITLIKLTKEKKCKYLHFDYSTYKTKKQHTNGTLSIHISHLSLSHQFRSFTSFCSLFFYYDVITIIFTLKFERAHEKKIYSKNQRNLCMNTIFIKVKFKTRRNIAAFEIVFRCDSRKKLIECPWNDIHRFFSLSHISQYS